MVRDRLLAGLQHVRTHPNFSHLRGKIDHASRVMSMDYGVQANYAGVDQAKQEALQYITTVKNQHQLLADHISTDYDGFLDTLSPYTMVSDSIDQKSYQTSLFTAYQPTIDVLTHQPDPRASYIAIHKPLVDGYAKTLQNRTAYELNMNQLDHATLQQYFGDLQDRIAFAEQDPLLAQATGPAPSPTPTQTPRLDQVDFTQYIKGFFVPGKDGNYHNVVARDK